MIISTHSTVGLTTKTALPHVHLIKSHNVNTNNIEESQGDNLCLTKTWIEPGNPLKGIIYPA